MCDKGNTNGMEMDTGLSITDVKADWQKLSRKVLPAKRTRSPESPKSQRFPKKINASKKIESSSDANSSSSESETDKSEEGEVKKFIFPKKTAKKSLMKNSIQNDELPSSSNRFATLPIESNNQTGSSINTSNDKPEESAAPKPPPIIIPGVTNIGKMLKDLDEVGSFSYKATKGGNVRIMPKDSTTYRKIVAHLDNLHLAFSTYQPKEERPFRIVIKGLHFSTPTSYIIDAFDKLGHKVRDIKNAVSKTSKSPMSMFFINLEPAVNNKKSFDITRLCHAVVSVEEPRKFDDIVQCFRCQAFGHTKKYCRMQFMCVKCGQEHDTHDCNKPNDILPTCGNCGDQHTASYRGCRIYMEAKKRFGPKPKIVAPPKQAPQPNPPPRVPLSQPRNKHFSYANIANNGSPQFKNENQSKNQVDADNESVLEQKLMQRMEQMMKTMFNQLKELIMTIFSSQMNMRQCP